jgi:2-polyprenyl-3-methyl-5-hydroxy-6-metoxy-1,4-benzoquinol methylase
MLIRNFIIELINWAKLPCLIMNSRTIVRRYFDWKYQKEDPYIIVSAKFDTRYQEMIDLLGALHFAKALDVGCGEGKFCEMLLEVCDAVIGIDISQSAINRALKEYEDHPRLTFRAADILTTNPDSQYDLIVCAEVLYYLNRRQLYGLIPKLNQWLLPNGCLLVGNIKNIRSGSGLFRSHIAAGEINKLFEGATFCTVVSKLDRGNDLITLFRKQAELP